MSNIIRWSLITAIVFFLAVILQPPQAVAGQSGKGKGTGPKLEKNQPTQEMPGKYRERKETEVQTQIRQEAGESQEQLEQKTRKRMEELEQQRKRNEPEPQNQNEGKNDVRKQMNEDRKAAIKAWTEDKKDELETGPGNKEINNQFREQHRYIIQNYHL